ncbi:DUF4230 domain-containing protein [[Limnothrix rosea] IAM M-220]|uniref:DUF4230 domain-containing protein n=1 Tax=[Limnothrix rosea] IAM M-220 TaxID=454133 RepID=UPI00155941C7|nr:DUF4230 domain-containing protein [[Limnothrix rosea] IAM M-220]
MKLGRGVFDRSFYTKKRIFLALGGLSLWSASTFIVAYGFYHRGFQAGFSRDLSERVIQPTGEIDFEPSFSVEDLVANLDVSGMNSPSSSFQSAIDIVYEDLLRAVGEYYELSEKEMQAISEKYHAEYSEDFANKHFESLSLSSQERIMSSSSFLNLNSYYAAEDFQAVLIGNFCLATGMLFTIVKVDKRYTALLNNACPSLIKYVVKPLAENMKNRGLESDLTTYESRIESRTRSTILELATAQETLEGKISKPVKKDVLFGALTSKHELVIEGLATVKAGFDLTNVDLVEFKLEEKEIHVKLPDATILSADVDYESILEKNGFFALFTGIDSEDISTGLSDFKMYMRNKALDGGILSRAEENACDTLINLYSPILNLPNSEFELLVYYGDNPQKCTNEM